MKNAFIRCAMLFLAVSFSFAGCDTPPNPDDGNTPEPFSAVILEINSDNVLVEPLEGEDARNSSDRIVFSKAELPDIGAKAGDTVSISYTGGIRESYPAQITATDWTIVSRAADPLDKTPEPDTTAFEAVEYRHEDIFMRLMLPADWAYGTLDEGEGSGAYGLRVYPRAEPEAELRLEYHPDGIGICGTGVTFTEMTFAGGLSATACTEALGDGAYWLLLTYHAPYESYAASFCADYGLWEQHEPVIWAILETVTFEDGETVK